MAMVGNPGHLASVASVTGGQTGSTGISAGIRHFGAHLAGKKRIEEWFKIKQTMIFSYIHIVLYVPLVSMIFLYLH